jgi:hypothetical protein
MEVSAANTQSQFAERAARAACSRHDCRCIQLCITGGGRLVEGGNGC